eukprot:2888910-Pleurochrysis_carterae.AAC.5
MKTLGTVRCPLKEVRACEARARETDETESAGNAEATTRNRGSRNENGNGETEAQALRREAGVLTRTGVREEKSMRAKSNRNHQLVASLAAEYCELLPSNAGFVSSGASSSSSCMHGRNATGGECASLPSSHSPNRTFDT